MIIAIAEKSYSGKKGSLPFTIQVEVTEESLRARIVYFGYGDFRFYGEEGSWGEAFVPQEERLAALESFERDGWTISWK